MEHISVFLSTYWQVIALCWATFAVVGTLALYVGYGFAMAAIGAHDKGLTSKPVFAIDAILCVIIGILDLVLNLLVYSIVCLDLRPRYWFTTISWRMTYYNEDPDESKYRRTVASIFQAFLDGKDPKGDHIRGPGLILKVFNSKSKV